MSAFRPLLAEKVNLATLEYPCAASPKYDGFRCLIDSMGNPLSRNMKPIANGYVYSKLQEMKLPRFDGELLTYTNGKVDIFDVVQSKLTTRSGMPDFKYMVFDELSYPNDPFGRRDARVLLWLNDHPGAQHGRLERVPQHIVRNEEELLEYEAEQLALGWEGVMVRDPDAPYKFGRSTTKEGILLKLKRFFDAEAVVVEKYELLHNANEAVINDIGYTERSSHKANMQGMGVLGKIKVEWVGKREIDFYIGSGFNAQQREEYWSDDFGIVGQTVTFKYQSVNPATGKPRFPIFKAIRNEE